MCNLPIMLSVIGCEKAISHSVPDLFERTRDNLAKSLFAAHFIEQFN